MNEDKVNYKDEYEYRGHDISIIRYFNELVCELNGINIPLLSINKEIFLEKYKKSLMYDLSSLGQMLMITKDLLTTLNKLKNSTDFNNYIKWKTKRKEEIDKMVDMYTENIYDIKVTDRYITIWNKTTKEKVNISTRDLIKFSEFLNSIKIEDDEEE